MCSRQGCLLIHTLCPLGSMKHLETNGRPSAGSCFYSDGNMAASSVADNPSIHHFLFCNSDWLQRLQHTCWWTHEQLNQVMKERREGISGQTRDPWRDHTLDFLPEARVVWAFLPGLPPPPRSLRSYRISKSYFKWYFLLSEVSLTDVFIALLLYCCVFYVLKGCFSVLSKIVARCMFRHVYL